MYPLPITNYRAVSRHTVGNYRVVVVTDCHTAGLIKIAHAALVYLPDSQTPLYAVAAETSAMSKACFLCVYADRHENYGSSPDYADLSQFTHAALQLITSRSTGSGKVVSPHIMERRRDVMTIEAALKNLDPDTQPEQYGLMQYRLDGALSILMAMEGMESFSADDQLALINRTMAACEACLRYLSLPQHPLECIESLASLGFNHYLLSDWDPESLPRDLDRLQKAVEYYEAALKADADYPGVWKERQRGQSLDNLGNACRDLGRMEQAFVYWRRAVEALEKSDVPKLADSARAKIAQYEEKQHAASSGDKSLET